MNADETISTAEAVVYGLENAINALVARILPECKKRATPADLIRIFDVTSDIKGLACVLVQPFSEALKEKKQQHNETRELLKRAGAALEGARAEITALQAEVRQVRDQRGMYESKKVNELEAQLRTKDHQIVLIGEKLADADNLAAKLRAELTGQTAAIAGYERDITQITTAAANNATSAKAALNHLKHAHEKISDRWPKPTPYIAAILADVETAQSSLASFR